MDYQSIDLQTCHPLTRAIIDYYAARGLQWPASDEAIDWHDTEMGEVQELWLARRGGWVRNNPDGKPSWDTEEFATELSDAIMMLAVAAIQQGQDPFELMLAKMLKKLVEHCYGKLQTQEE